MSGALVRTRFAPSPTGAMHLGNLRTALFNWLFARHCRGAFLVRSEDTDAERSDERHMARMLDGLGWLGLDWDEGPDGAAARGPYRQSERLGLYRGYLDALLAADLAYPCFCTREELAAARHRQLAAGQPPRYPGTCAGLSEAERDERRRAGRPATLRFRVPDTGSIAVEDLVHGHRRYVLADIGDFVIARADGVPAFFFANAVDDALMAVTHVLRGEDHLTNTPRQLLLLAALGLEPPAYGHFPLILGDDGRPLSKRHGAASLDDLRHTGHRPEAVVNHLVRLGYRPGPDTLMDLDALAAGFDLGRVGRAAARHDPQALEGWQRRAVESMDGGALWAWLQEHRPDDAVDPPANGELFAEAVRANVVLPADAWCWARRLFDDAAEPDAEAGREIAAAGPVFFRAAAGVDDPSPAEDFAGWARAVGRATGAKGRTLYRPLRAALTGTVEGPELGAVVPLMPEALVYARLRRSGAD